MASVKGLQKSANQSAGAALFWGKLLTLLDAGSYTEVRAIIAKKATQRLAAVDHFTAMAKAKEAAADSDPPVRSAQSPRSES